MFTIKEILKSTGGRLIKGIINRRISGVSIDSRTIKENEIFMAIKGRRFDGHSFIEQAISSGAGAILFSNLRYEKSALNLGALNSIPMVPKKRGRGAGRLQSMRRWRVSTRWSGISW